MDDHAIDCVMQLPNHSFHDTEARCFILILTKDGAPVEKVKLTRYDQTTGLSSPIFISRIDALQRMDFDFHASQKTPKNGMVTLRELGADIKRGSLSTIQRKDSAFNTFHTTDYSNLADGRIAFKSTDKLPINRKMVIAETGDILMARVDRSLHHKIGIVMSGSAALTDCVYRVRLPIQVREMSFNALRSPAGMASLLSASKGVSARLLGKADLLDLPLKIEKS
jgi:type I restriction enzyme M protein